MVPSNVGILLRDFSFISASESNVRIYCVSSARSEARVIFQNKNYYIQLLLLFLVIYRYSASLLESDDFVLFDSLDGNGAYSEMFYAIIPILCWSKICNFGWKPSYCWKGFKYTKMRQKQRTCGTWRIFLKNHRQFNCSGQTRDAWTTITKQKKKKKNSCGSCK